MSVFVFRPDEFHECDPPQVILNPSNSSDIGCTSVSGEEMAYNHSLSFINAFFLYTVEGRPVRGGWADHCNVPSSPRDRVPREQDIP